MKRKTISLNYSLRPRAESASPLIVSAYGIERCRQECMKDGFMEFA